MNFEENKDCFVAGYKQVMKAISKNAVKKIYIAEDCEDRLKSSLNSSLDESIEVEMVSTMQELGKLCGVDIGTSCVAVLK